jgi:hypothetical protein
VHASTFIKEMQTTHSIFLETNYIFSTIDSVFHSVFDLFFNFIYVTSIFFDVVIVNPRGTLALEVEEPDEDGELEHVVEGDEMEDEAGELVDHIEQTEDHPVDKPLLFVAQTVRFEGVEAHEHGEGNTQESSEDGLADAEHDEEHQADQTVL